MVIDDDNWLLVVIFRMIHDDINWWFMYNWWFLCWFLSWFTIWWIWWKVAKHVSNDGSTWSFLWDYTFHKWGHHLLLLGAASSQEEKDLAISIRLTRTGSLQGHHLETRWCQRDDLCRSSIWDNDDYIYIYIIWGEIKPQ